MINQIIKTPAPVTLTDNAIHLPSGTKGGKVADFVQTGENVYVWAGEGDIDSRPEIVDAILVTSTGYDGSYISADLAEYETIRPLGNNADGTATTDLQYATFAGHGPRELEPGRLYPADNEPFDIEVRHKQFLGNANPAWDGWGWRAEMHGAASTRDPSARAIAIYSDAACTQYLYTTGAFVQEPSEWQVDDQGQPLTVWATEYNPGLLGYDNDEKQDVHHAVLLGSAQEGHMTLSPDQESARHLYWDRIQGQEPDPGAVWTDTGVTVVGYAGTLYNMSEVVVMTLGETIRIGDQEGEFTGYWPTPSTPSTYIGIDPYGTMQALGSHLWRLL